MSSTEPTRAEKLALWKEQKARKALGAVKTNSDAAPDRMGAMALDHIRGKGKKLLVPKKTGSGSKRGSPPDEGERRKQRRQVFAKADFQKQQAQQTTSSGSDGPPRSPQAAAEEPEQMQQEAQQEARHVEQVEAAPASGVDAGCSSPDVTMSDAETLLRPVESTATEAVFATESAATTATDTQTTPVKDESGAAAAATAVELEASRAEVLSLQGQLAELQTDLKLQSVKADAANAKLQAATLRAAKAAAAAEEAAAAASAAGPPAVATSAVGCQCDAVAASEAENAMQTEVEKEAIASTKLAELETLCEQLEDDKTSLEFGNDILLQQIGEVPPRPRVAAVPP